MMDGFEVETAVLRESTGPTPDDVGRCSGVESLDFRGYRKIVMLSHRSALGSDLWNLI